MEKKEKKKKHLIKNDENKNPNIQKTENKIKEIKITLRQSKKN